MKFIIYLLIFFRVMAYAQDSDFDPSTDIIGPGQIVGKNLGYDCKEKRFRCYLSEDSCVKESFCISIKKLETKKSCFQAQLYYVSRGYSSLDCHLVNIK